MIKKFVVEFSKKQTLSIGSEALSAIPPELRKTFTYDQGREMSKHAQLTEPTGVAVYFCDPHSPWQRGLNENTNGLLRQYPPTHKNNLTYCMEFEYETEKISRLRITCRGLQRTPFECAIR